MSYYVRMIKLDRWEQTSSSEDDISGEAVTIDWKCQNNEWSVFKCDSYVQKNDEVNKIVLRMAGDNQKSTIDGIDLLYLDDSFIENAGLMIDPDKESVLYSLHCNLRFVNFDKIKKAIAYTIRNLKERIISYTPEEIRKLFLNADSEYIEKYENTYHLKLKNIKKAFLVDIPKGKVFKSV